MSSPNINPIETIQKNVPSAASHEASDKTTPWVTFAVCAICISIYFSLLYRNNYEAYDAVTWLLYPSAVDIWDGALWGPVTSAFVHFELWHLAFNVFWLWVLGRRMEQAIGSWRYLLFFLTAAFVSSSFELAVGGGTGIGASGAAYAIFGFMWAARKQFASFAAILSQRLIALFVWSAVACIVLTHFEILRVGNAAHVSGLIFGALVAWALAGSKPARLAKWGAAAMMLLSITTLFWAPWSIQWHAHRMYKLHVAERYEEAIAEYERFLRYDPENEWALSNLEIACAQLGERGEREIERGNYQQAIECYDTIIRAMPNAAWAYYNRGIAYMRLGSSAEAAADWNRARALDPKLDWERGINGSP